MYNCPHWVTAEWQRKRGHCCISNRIKNGCNLNGSLAPLTTLSLLKLKKTLSSSDLNSMPQTIDRTCHRDINFPIISGHWDFYSFTDPLFTVCINGTKISQYSGLQKGRWNTFSDSKMIDLAPVLYIENVPSQIITQSFSINYIVQKITCLIKGKIFEVPDPLKFFKDGYSWSRSGF